MPRTGSIDPKDPIAEIVETIFGGVGLPSGVKFSMPVVIIEDLVADATTRGVQNPFDSDCLVAAILNITTVDATETMDVGVAANATTSADTLLDDAAVDTVATKVSFDDGDSGTNGKALKLLDRKGGTNDFVTYTATAGTDTLAGQLILIFIPINE